MVSVIKKYSFAVIALVMGGLSINAQSAKMWNINKTNTSVNFSINHLFSSVNGNFKSFDGSFYFDINNTVGSKADFTVVVNSLDTDSKKRDSHLQSKEFFDSKSYPKMTFQSTKFEKKSDAEYLIYGKLTIKNVTKSVTLSMKITQEIEDPMMKETLILGVVIDTIINRTEYGVGSGDFATSMVVGEEVRIHIPMELYHKN